MMPEHITYYAIVDGDSSRGAPVGVIRRTSHDKGQRDEVFGRDLHWGRTRMLYSYEQGNRDQRLYLITEEEATTIADRIRRESETP
jgi:hypothetical protein